MTKLKVHIVATSALDPLPEPIGISIDEPLPPNFVKIRPEAVIGSAYKSFDKWIELDIPEGEHSIYVTIPAPLKAPWIVEVEIPGITWFTHVTTFASPSIVPILVPKAPPEEVEVIPEVVAVVPDEVAVVPPVKVPPKIEVVPLEVPALPWYVAWLQPVLDYVGLLTEAVVNFFAPVFEPISMALAELPKLVTNGLGELGSSLADFTSIILSGGRTVITDLIKGLSQGSPEWEEDFKKDMAPIEQKIVSEYQKALDVKTYEHSPLVGNEAVLALEDMKNKVLATALFNFGLHAAAEAGSLGQFEALRDIDSMVTSKFGMYRLIEASTMLPIEKAVLIPAEQEFNSRYTPLLPAYADLINMRIKEVIDEKSFNEALAKSGYSSAWAGKIWEAHFNPPNYMQLLDAHYRGTISLDELKQLRTIVDLDPRFANIWDSLVEQVPPYSELVNERVKEVIDEKTFTKYLQWYGFNPEWSKRIWDAHFYPPSLGDLLTAWRRGIINESRLDELMILVDLDPRFKEIFDTRKYVDPSLREARYMFELGAIDSERLASIVHRQGYTADDSKAMTEYLAKFQERMWRQRYLYALESGFSVGAIPENELTQAVLDAGYSKEVAGWMIQTAEVKTRIIEHKREVPKPKLLSDSNLKKAYILDKMTSDVLRTELLSRGYDLAEVDILISIMDDEKMISEEGKRVVTLSVTQLLSAYRYGEITRDDLMIRLQSRGLAVDEAETLIGTKEKQWGLGG